MFVRTVAGPPAEGPSRMTIAKGDPQGRASDAARRGAGAATCRTTARPQAAAVEQRPQGRCSTRSATCKRTRIGADVLCEALLRQGVDVFFSATRAASSCRSTTSSATTPSSATSSSATSRAARHAADGYARVTGRVGVCMGTSGPGATNLVTGIGDGAAGLGADGRDHRQRARRPDRQGRLPGDRHQRHHAADDQAQLPGPRRRRPPAGRRRGVPHRPVRPARARSTSTSPRTPSSRRRAPSTRPRRGHRRAARASARTSTAIPRQLKLAARRSPAAKRPLILAGHGVLHRRGLGRAARVRREDADPGRLDAAGDRRHRRDATRWPTATWACTAGSTSTGRSRRADLLIAIGMRFDDRVTGNVRTYAPVRADHPRRHRPGRDRQERRGRGADRGRRQARPAGADRGWSPAVDPEERARVLRPAGRSGRRDSEASSWHGSGAWRDGAAVRRLRHRADRRADRPRRDLRRRRRPEPDVARPLRRLPPARTATSARAASGTMGFSRPGGDGRGARRARTRDLGDHRRRRLPDDVPGADDPGRRTGSRSRSRCSTTRSSG